MRRLLSFLACCAGVGGCANPPEADGRVAELEQRVAALESRLEALDGAEIAAEPAAFVQVEYEIGDAEFHGGDTIVITSVRGDRPAFGVGGSYEIRGRYRLDSRERATLLLGVTATEPGCNGGDTSPSAITVLSRGEGEFVLLERVTHPGKPHLTLYGSDGRPFGGVYFGAGEFLLAQKDWRYQ